MIQLKTPAEIAVMRRAGLVVARTLDVLRAAVAPGVTTAALDEIAEAEIRGVGAVPSFKGYRGFPATICTSVNEQIVHGIPSRSKTLRAGDIVSIDCGAIVDGWHGDAAITVAVGDVRPEIRRLLQVCEASLWRGFAAARLGGRLVDISRAVEETIRPHAYGIVQGYGGHGIGTAMHMEPHVLNYVERRSGKGPKLVAGLCLAIEPMVNLGHHATRELNDGWTVVTRDGSWSAHFEHTLALTAEGPWVLTAHDGGAGRLAELGVQAYGRVRAGVDGAQLSA